MQVKSVYEIKYHDGSETTTYSIDGYGQEAADKIMKFANPGNNKTGRNTVILKGFKFGDNFKSAYQIN